MAAPLTDRLAGPSLALLHYLAARDEWRLAVDANWETSIGALQPIMDQPAPATDHEGCEKHPGEPSIGVCSECRHSVCEICRLVTAERELCIDCALVAAGVRTSRRATG